MAEAVAVLGLISSIASLVELGVDIADRLRDFASKTSDVPESFRSLSNRLPLLTDTVQRIETQAKAHQLSEDANTALTAVVRDTSERLQSVRQDLLKILPSDGASRLERASKALKSLARDGRMQQALKKIEQNTNVLSLYQTTGHVDTSNRILAQLSELSILTKSASASRSFGKDELLSLARSAGQTAVEELNSQTYSILANVNKGLLYRFSQLPIAAQRRFMAQQEEQLTKFVEEEEAKLLDLLAAFDTRERLADNASLRVEGSCEWILSRPEYLNWLSGKNNRLWLLAGPGFGKTVMSAFIAESLNNQLGHQDILAAYACSFSDLQTRSIRYILYALAAQIAHGSSTSMEKCKRFLESHVSHGKLEAQLQDIQDLIVEMSLSADVHCIYIVIDGLDEVECERADDFGMILDIPRYARKIKVLITSRSCAHFTGVSQGYTTILMNEVDVNLDIAEFIDSELRRSKLENLPQYEFNEVKDRLISTSNGMYVQHLSGHLPTTLECTMLLLKQRLITSSRFVHARLVIKLLSESYQNPRAFQQTKETLLQHLPTSLEDFYDLRMLNIDANNSANEAAAVKTYLKLLATADEMQSFAEFQQAATHASPELRHFTPEDMVARAQGLLTWHAEDSSFRFVHQSARDYILLHTC